MAERYVRLGKCEESTYQWTLDFQGRRFHVHDRVGELVFGPVKFIDLFKRVFSDYNPREKDIIADWEPEWEQPNICKYFRPWKPEITEEVEDESIMLKCYWADLEYKRPWQEGKKRFKKRQLMRKIRMTS